MKKNLEIIIKGIVNTQSKGCFKLDESTINLRDNDMYSK